MRATRITLWAVWASFVAFCPTLLRAQAEAERVRVARLVEKLGAASFRDREAAGEELARGGTDVRAALRRAAESDDPEIRLRAQTLLRELLSDDLWQPSRVTMAGPGKASELLATMAAQTGNRLEIGDDYAEFRDTPLEFTFRGEAFWPALDTLCRSGGCRYRPQYDPRRPGLVVVSGELGNNPVAYSGPLRARLIAARRQFKEELDYTDATSKTTHSFLLEMELMWEDGFRLVAHRARPEVLAASLNAGAPLKPEQPSAGSWTVASGKSHQATVNLRLSPPPTTADRLERLELTWGVVAVGDFGELEIDDLAVGRTYTHEDIELHVGELGKRGGPRWDVTLIVTRDLALPDPTEILFEENEFVVYDSLGSAMYLQGQSGSLTERGVRLRLNLIGESDDRPPKQLTFRYPRLRAQRELKLVFKDVPLPTSRPE